jgi:hypothetical protein
VYAKSVLSFNQAVNDHTKTFESKKSNLMRSNVDVIDCAQYGGCNNNANGVGGVGVNVDNTNTMIGHRNAVQNAGNSLDEAQRSYNFYLANFKQASRTYNSASSAVQSAQVRVNNANGRGRQCYSVGVAPTCGATCGGIGRPRCNHNLHLSIRQTAQLPYPDLQCPTYVDRSNWLHSTHHHAGDRFHTHSQHNIVTVTRIDQFGPWGMTFAMSISNITSSAVSIFFQSSKVSKVFSDDLPVITSSTPFQMAVTGSSSM